MCRSRKPRASRCRARWCPRWWSATLWEITVRLRTNTTRTKLRRTLSRRATENAWRCWPRPAGRSRTRPGQATEMHARLHHLRQLLVWWWSHRNAGTIDHPLGAGFLIPIITAIIAIATTVARFVADAGILVFKTLESAVKFAAKGVVWLTGVTRKGFSELLGCLQHTCKSIERWLVNLYCCYQRLKDKLERVFGPIVRFMQKVQRWYDMIWKRWVVPVLNLMQRMRKLLARFKLVHLK